MSCLHARLAEPSTRDKLVTCGRCNGRGRITEWGWTGQREKPCPKCEGDGSIFIPYHCIRCKKCGGRGGEFILGVVDPPHWEECDRCRGLGWKEPSASYGVSDYTIRGR